MKEYHLETKGWMRATPEWSSKILFFTNRILLYNCYITFLLTHPWMGTKIDFTFLLLLIKHWGDYYFQWMFFYSFDNFSKLELLGLSSTS